MACVAKRLLRCSAARVACALGALWAPPAAGESSFKLFTPETLEIAGDVRLVGIDGEKGWLEGGFGKLRAGSDGDLRVRPQLGNVDLIWQPQLGWALSATVVGSLQGGERTEAGLGQAYLNYRPMRSNSVSFSARAGLMFPPVSLEHEGADWHVKDSITPSAINSWIGEEVKPVAIEGTVAANVASHKVRATAALLAANDTSGTLLTFRGWALHDRTTLAFHRWPLPPFDGEIAEYQAPSTHPLIDLHHGFPDRLGYYAKLAWQPPIPVRIELFRYDNRAHPKEVNSDSEWGWRTQFDNVGLVAALGSGAQLKAQAMQGRTRMGYVEGGRHWVDNRFRAAFVLLSRPFGKFGISLRADAFDTRNRGSLVDHEYDDTGWSAMAAVKREWDHFTGLVELLHVSSRREDRDEVELKPRQHQTQVQAELRMHW
jgi:hypothetical protein